MIDDDDGGDDDVGEKKHRLAKTWTSVFFLKKEVRSGVIVSFIND
jgi:hypothetical protein